MKVVRAALICFGALLAIWVGVARAATGGGGTISAAPTVLSGAETSGSTSTYTGSCDTGFEFWKLQLQQGDRVEITWGANTAVDQLALWPGGTTDAAYGSSCIYNAGWSDWNVSPVLADTNSTPGTPHTVHAVVDSDGTYPLVFVSTTPANAGPYSFTAVVRHAASISFAQQSAIPGAGVFKAAVVAPDANLISDSMLKLTLNGYWSGRAGAAPHRHVLATATPIDGIVTFDYSLPPALWGKKIGLDISGGGASYQPVLSKRESVKVLVSTSVSVIASAREIKVASKLLHEPIYWAGPQKGYHYEFSRTTNGWDYVRYLPKGVKVNGKPGQLPIIATYPVTNAYGRLKKAAKGSLFKGPRGSIYWVFPGDPKSVYVAFPKVNYEIEVYDPKPAVARKIAASGRVRPVR